ncbi:MAG: DUF1501 domain-containing protein [Planctomycetes bacterium]|nr:DUF1501 domain-containing protein [Planctomycetota bacterium]
MPVITRRKLFQAVFNPAQGPSGDVLVTVFLRGGADGLNIVVPHTDEAYYRARPGIALTRPDAKAAKGVPGGGRVIDLDGRFGFHPALEPLLPAWQAGELAVAHAVGSEDATRSHFEAQDWMERGAGTESGVSGGWIARHLRSRRGTPPGALAAVAIGPTVPESLRGAPAATALESLEELRLHGDGGQGPQLAGVLASLYGDGDDPLLRAGRETLGVMESVRKLVSEPFAPGHSKEFPYGHFGHSLGQVARLVRADLGLEAATIDLGGWDTHFVQGSATGLQADRLGELARGLAAFRTDVGDRWKDVTIVVMTEFGRRLQENTSLGTDHGRASAMFVLGGGVVGGRVYGDWPGLAPESLEVPGDLRVTTDYRSVLADVLEARLANDRVDAVFPGVKGTGWGLVRRRG